jgi:hypothetical protein
MAFDSSGTVRVLSLTLYSGCACSYLLDLDLASFVKMYPSRPSFDLIHFTRSAVRNLWPTEIVNFKGSSCGIRLLRSTQSLITPSASQICVLTKAPTTPDEVRQLWVFEIGRSAPSVLNWGPFAKWSNKPRGKNGMKQQCECIIQAIER